MLVSWLLGWIFLTAAYGMNGSKAALIGTSDDANKVADLAMIELANTKIEMLERAAVDKVMDEQKLSRSGLTAGQVIGVAHVLKVDLFAIVSDRERRRDAQAPLELIVFNADNGIRLVDVALSADFEAAASEVKQLLESAQRKKQEAHLQFVSVLEVRTIVPVECRAPTASWVIRLERALSMASGMAVVEREYLDQVNRERQITGTFHALATSAKLLRLEFQQGESAAIVNLILRVTDASHKELFRIEQPDCLNDDALKTVVAKLQKKLGGKGETESFAATAEAERLFKEFQYLSEGRQYREAYAKLSSAIALVPEREAYRLAQLDSLDKYCPDWNRSDRDNRLENYSRKVIQFADACHQDFPQCTDCYSSIYFLFEHMNNFVSDGFGNIDPAQLPKIQTLATELRTRYWTERDRLYPLGKLENEIKSADAYKQFRHYYEKFSYSMYYDAEAFSTEAVRLVEAEMTYLLKHPEALAGLGNGRNGYGVALLSERCGLRQRPLSHVKIPAEVRWLIIKKSPGIIALMRQYPNRHWQAEGDLLAIFRDYFWDHDERKLRKQLQGWKRPLAWSSESMLPDYEKLLSETHWPSAAGMASHPISSSAARRKAAVRRETQDDLVRVYTSVDEFWTGYQKMRTLAGQVALLERNRSLLLSVRDANAQDRLVAMGCHFFSLFEAGYREQDLQCFLRGLKVIFPELEIVSVVRGSKDVLQPMFYHAQLFYNEGGSGLAVWNSGSGQIQRIKLPWTEVFRLSGFRVMEKQILLWGLHVNTRNPTLALLDRSGRRTSSLIAGLPLGEIQQAEIMDDRIYVWDRHTLFSCDFQGNSRKLEISGRREDQLNVLDKKVEYITGWITDPTRHRLLFGMDRNVSGGHVDDGIWEYCPATGKTAQLPNIGRVMAIWKYPADYAGADLEPLDLSQTDPACLAEKSLRKSAGYIFYYSHEPDVLPPCPQLQPGLYWNRVLTAMVGNSARQLALPWNRRKTVLALPDGKSVLVFGDHALIRVTPHLTLEGTTGIAGQNTDSERKLSRRYVPAFLLN